MARRREPAPVATPERGARAQAPPGRVLVVYRAPSSRRDRPRPASRSSRSVSLSSWRPQRPTTILISGHCARRRLQRCRAWLRPPGATAPMQTSAGRCRSTQATISAVSLPLPLTSSRYSAGSSRCLPSRAPRHPPRPEPGIPRSGSGYRRGRRRREGRHGRERRGSLGSPAPRTGRRPRSRDRDRGPAWHSRGRSIVS